MILIILIMIIGLIIALFYTSHVKVKIHEDKNINDSLLYVYQIDTSLVKDILYNDCPPLPQERFRRRVKMLLGVDINDYPKNSWIYFGLEFQLSKENQIIRGFKSPGEDEPITWIDNHSDTFYNLFRNYLLYNDENLILLLEEYKMDVYKQALKKNGGDYPAQDKNITLNSDILYFCDFLSMAYESSVFSIPENLLSYRDLQSLHGYPLYPLSFNAFVPVRISDIRQDLLILYLKKEIEAGRTISSSIYPEDGRLWLGFDMLEHPLWHGNYAPIGNIIELSVYDIRPNKPWMHYTASRGISSYLYFLTYLNHKNLDKLVICFFTGELDHFLGRNSWEYEQIRQEIKENNYYGYTLLREFCENPMREMPTLEKIGSSFTGTVKEREELLLLEPFKESYDIDTVYMGEHFIAYEMGHDDYYFIEIEKPVESPVAGPDGYAMILDRTEKVYGYLPKTVVKELNQDNMLEEEVFRDIRSAQYGIINDPDGYVNIRQEGNSQSKIVGTIKEGEIFNYWITPSNWYIVESRSGVRGFVYKDRIKKYESKDNWIIEE